MVQWTNQWQILENMGQVIALKELYCPKVFTSTISRLENLGHATSTMVPILLRSSTCYQNGHQKKSMETALAWAQNARSTQIPLFSTDPKIFTRSSRGAYSPRISQNRPTACPSGRLWRFLVQNASKKVHRCWSQPPAHHGIWLGTLGQQEVPHFPWNTNFSRVIDLGQRIPCRIFPYRSLDWTRCPPKRELDQQRDGRLRNLLMTILSTFQWRALVTLR